MPSTPRIAVIGAGPAGCMLARLLHVAGIPTVVFESESSPDYRSQGGTLDLHTSTGLAALQKAGLFEDFLAAARYDGDHLQITDHRCKVFLEIAGPTTHVEGTGGNAGKLRREQRPEIDRAELRRILTESLPPGMIRWGHHLRHFDAERRTLTFDGPVPPESGFDLVVGADGAWSKVRAAIVHGDQGKPVSCGVGGYELSIPDPQTAAPELLSAVKRGSVFAHAEHRRLCMQQMGDGSLSVYVLLKQDDENWAQRCGYDSKDLAQVKDALLEGENSPFRDWDPLLRSAISKAEGKCVPRTLYQLPPGLRWEHQSGVTLIGDAAHLMSPFAGEGVNVALSDAMNLAGAIVKAVGEGGDQEVLDRAVKEYEEDMWPRAGKVALLADRLTKLWMFEKGTPGSVMVATTASHVNFDKPWYLQPLTTAMVRGYFLFKWIVG